MERKIGEIFEHNGEWYQCLESNICRCDYCDYGELGDCNKIACASGERSDDKEVHFKKLEKVGDPFTIVGKLCQHYKVFDIDNVCGDGFWFVHNYKAKTLTIEIKQNKEDMEEKKLNLKPFDIQKAREGKPVCTRDGRKVRIICFDRVTNTTNEYTGHLIVLVTNTNGDEQSFYYTEKGNLAGEDEYDNHKWDLMMPPEKKEGWVNIVKEELSDDRVVLGRIFDIYEDAFRSGKANERYIATVKIEWTE